MPKFENETMIYDTLYCLTEDARVEVDYGRGIFIGIAATIMAVYGIPLYDAMPIIAKHAPYKIRMDCIPIPYRKMFSDAVSSESKRLV